MTTARDTDSDARMVGRATSDGRQPRTTTQVLIIEDFPVTQRGIAAALSECPDIEVLGAADDGRQGLGLALELKPDVIVLDIRLPELDGVTLLKHLARDRIEVRALVVTASEDADTLLEAVAAGAAGYLTKRATQEELCQAVREVARGGSVITPLLAGHLLRRYSQGLHDGGSGQGARLARREEEILRLVAQGHTDREIALQLGVSPRTVQNQLKGVREKVGLRRRAELARWATERAM